MSPLPVHERANRKLAQIVEVVTEEWEMDCESLGSTTFSQKRTQRGFEPDSCFYLQNTDHMRQITRIDLNRDPAPDLVIEIDVTSPSINKLPLYADIGVHEVWRRVRDSVQILRLTEAKSYESAAASRILPPLTADILEHFLQEGRILPSTAWLKLVRDWARQNRPQS